MTLKLYYYDQCPFCQLVLRKIQELNLGDKIEFCNTLENPEHRKYHTEKTGRTTVPCLYIDDEPMFESRDIVNWLDSNQSKI